jgi:hypothetical protein
MLGRDERGLALPSSLAVLSTVAVVVAGVVFFTTSPDEKPAEQARPVATSPTAAPTSTAPEPTVTEEPAKQPRKVKKKPAVQRGKVYVEVYNNSGISGLAGQTATRASDAGWQVVGSDNWYGTIPASTVYYPPRLEAAAELLGKDLGVNRLRPAVAPMRLDRLTVILTG